MQRRFAYGSIAPATPLFGPTRFRSRLATTQPCDSKRYFPTAYRGVQSCWVYSRPSIAGHPGAWRFIGRERDGDNFRVVIRIQYVEIARFTGETGLGYSCFNISSMVTISASPEQPYIAGRT